MKNLKMKLQLIIEDGNSTRINESTFTIIEEDVRMKSHIVDILEEELESATKRLFKKSFSNHTLPWNKTLREFEKEVEDKFELQFPDYESTIISSDGKICFFDYSKKEEFLEEIQELPNGDSITVYKSMFKRYEKGWSYQYQAGNAPESCLDLITPPIPEDQLNAFLNSFSFPVELIVWPTFELAEKYEEE